MSPPLLDRRLIFVTGKGGVGKSTVAIALGMLASGQGLRTVVAEIGGDDRVARALGADPGGGPGVERRIDERLFTISIDPQRAMEEYLRVKAGPAAPVLSHSRMFGALATATPGMRELLTIGKVWELAQLQRRTRDGAPYDLVIVDAPATGHGVGFLRTPAAFAEMAKVGPIAHQGRAIAATIADRSFTGLLAVCTPEEMPVNETLVLDAELRADGLELDAVILNARYPDRFTETDLTRIEAGLAAVSGSAPTGSARDARAALRAALSEHARAAAQRRQQDRVTAEIAAPVLTLPHVFAPSIGPNELAMLVAGLEPLTADPAPLPAGEA